MKLTILILCLCVLQVSASISTRGQNFDLQVQSQTLKEVLKAIENKTSYRFFYNDVVIDLNKMVTLNLNDKNIQEVMDELLSDSEASFKILNDNLIVIAPAMELQQTSIQGTITDAATGEKLPGVNVVIEGTTIGAITDIDGKYTIEVKPNVVLVFSYVGYLSERITYTGQASIDVKLSPDVKKLDEIVVVGYGSVKKSDISGSVVSVGSEEMLKKAPSNILQGLKGAAAGVMVTSQDGAPDANAAIRIRGIATITGSADPLYVVDGVQVGTSANFLAPNDVESIEILKDASATAIYGAAGANGVIMITTKHGKAGKANISFSADYGVQTLGRTLKVGDADQYAKNIRQARFNDGNGTNLDNQIFAEQYDGRRKTIDWQKEMTRVSLRQQYSLSASGGTEKTQSSLSLSYLNNDGIVINTNYKRLSGRANVITKVSNFLEIGGDLNFIHTESNGSNGNLGNNGNMSSLRDWAFLCPTMDYVAGGNIISPKVVNSDGSFGTPIQGSPYDGNLSNNIYAEQMENTGITKNNQMLVSAYTNINIFKGLTFKSIASYNLTTVNWYNYWGGKRRFLETADGISEVTLSGGDNSVYLGINNSNYNRLAIENYLTYNWKTDVHNLTLMAGNSLSKGYGNWSNAQGKGFPAANIRDISLTDVPADRIGSGAYNLQSRGLSYFGRVMYSLKDRYILTATLRRDGSSNFGVDNQWGTFPSAAVAWRISEESFLRDNATISNLKLRLGWGQTGNAGNIGNKATSALTSNNVAYFFYGQNGIAGPSTTRQLGNGYAPTVVDTKLKWETNEQTNIGLDLGLLRSDLNITADYFIRTSNDLLLYQPARPSSGTILVYTNYGNIVNKGIELSINYRKKLNQDWSIGVNLTGSSLKNKVKKMGADLLSENTDKTNDGSNIGAIGAPSGTHWNNHSICREGYAVGSFYGYKVEGIFRTQAELDAANAAAVAEGHNQYQNPGTVVGDYKYRDLNGDGFIDEKDMTILGNGIPKLNYGLNLNVSYKNLDLSVSTYGVMGSKIYSYSAMTLSNMFPSDNGTTPNILTEVANDSWTAENPNATYPRLSFLDLNYNMRGSDVWVKKGDFFKISNIQLGYNLGKNLLKPLHLESARINFTIMNPLCISKYNKYGDPEVGQGSVLFSGLDTGRYPVARIYSFGLNIQF